jgi:hypothetical protein
LFLKFAIPLCLAALAWAQQAPPGKLKINVLAGQGSQNNILQGVAAQPAVEVLNESNAPVADAEVIFEAPAEGPGGTFFGTRTYTARTDAKGRAQAAGLAPNNLPGKFNIAVRAKTANAAGDAVIGQTNGGPVGGREYLQQNHKKTWIIMGAIAAAAAAGGIIVATGGNGTPAAAAATKRPVTIGAGPITIGGPR